MKVVSESFKISTLITLRSSNAALYFTASSLTANALLFGWSEMIPL